MELDEPGESLLLEIGATCRKRSELTVKAGTEPGGPLFAQPAPESSTAQLWSRVSRAVVVSGASRPPMAGDLR